MRVPFGPANCLNVYTADNTPGFGGGAPMGQLSVKCIRADLFVSNAPVYISFQMWVPGITAGSGPWGPDEYVPCATGQSIFYSTDCLITGIRCKNASTGTAVVAGVLTTEEDFPFELVQLNDR